MSIGTEQTITINIPGPLKCYITQMGGGRGVTFSRKKHYEGVRFNVISIRKGWVGVQFPEESVM